VKALLHKPNYLIIILLISISSLLTQACTSRKMHLARIKGSQVHIDSLIPADKEMSQIIAPYKHQLEKEMNEVLAYSKGNYYKNMNAEKGETAIGDFLADLCQKRGGDLFLRKTGKNVDFTLLNYGGIRDGIAKGDVTVSTAYQIMPFENSMVVVELTYDKLLELIEYLAAANKAHPISKELQLVIRDTKPEQVLIKGKKPDKSLTYHVLTSDYLQHGGDKMFFFSNPVKLYILDYKIRQAILDEFKESLGYGRV